MSVGVPVIPPDTTESMRSGMFVPLRFAPVSTTFVMIPPSGFDRFAPVRLAADRFVDVRFVLVNVAFVKLAPDRFADVRLVFVNVAPVRLAPARFAEVRFVAPK